MGKRTLITGCSSGLGRAMAAEFASHGYEVIATARRPDTLDDLPAEITRIQLDVRDAGSIASAFAKAGQVDVLVNNAAYGVRGPIETVPVTAARRVFETNFFGVVRTIQAVLPQMRNRRSGTIVNISSGAGIHSRPLYGFYAATKHALEAISEALSYEVEFIGIRVMVIQPGLIQSNFRSSSEQFDDSAYPYSTIAHAWDGKYAERNQQATSAKTVAAAVVAAVENPNNPLQVAIGFDGESVRRKTTDNPAEFRRWMWSTLGLSAADF